MYAIDPREFKFIVTAYEIAKNRFDQFSDEDIQNLQIHLSIKNEIRNNEIKYQHERERRKEAPVEYEKVKYEYWNRGAGYNVEYLKVQKDKLKQEIIDLEELLTDPDKSLNALYDSLAIFKSSNLDIDFYEEFIKKYQKYFQEIDFYSVFTVKEGEEEKTFCIVPKFFASLVYVRDFNLISDQSTLARYCLKRSVGEEFDYLDGDGSVRHFKVISSRLITKNEIDTLIQKWDRNLVVRESKSAVDLNGWISNNSRYRKGG